MNRRQFLGSTLGAGAATITYGGQLSRVAEAQSDPQPNNADDFFTAGTLVAVAASSISVLTGSDADTDVVVLAVAETTHFCRQHCDYDVGRLKVGDRIECGVTKSLDGSLIAQFVNANARYGHGHVAALEPDCLIIEDDHSVDRLLRLMVGPWSHVVSADGFDVTDRFSSLVSLGDMVFFTGTSDVPDQRSNEVWAYVVTVAGIAGSGEEARLGELR